MAALAEEILTEGPGQIKALVTHAGNPVLSTPNGRQLERALAGLEFMAAIDFYDQRNDAARAHYSATQFVARARRTMTWRFICWRCATRPNSHRALFERDPATRHEWEILLELQTRMEHAGVFGRSQRKVIRRFFGPERLLDLGLRFGPYGEKLNPFSRV